MVLMGMLEYAWTEGADGVVVKEQLEEASDHQCHFRPLIFATCGRLIPIIPPTITVQRVHLVSMCRFTVTNLFQP